MIDTSRIEFDRLFSWILEAPLEVVKVKVNRIYSQDYSQTKATLFNVKKSAKVTESLSSTKMLKIFPFVELLNRQVKSSIFKKIKKIQNFVNNRTEKDIILEHPRA